MKSHRFRRLTLMLGVPAVVFAVVLGVLSFANRPSDRFADGAALPGVPAGVAVPGDTAAAVANLEDAVQDDPASADFQAALGDALY
ncbi:MAG: tetratricopeptide repeat protein, partial [Gemmatimonadota bacterium]|nr:tetratricopeptide repeat protein [Gemmatimonadota bacterium]